MDEERIYEDAGSCRVLETYEQNSISVQYRYCGNWVFGEDFRWPSWSIDLRDRNCDTIGWWVRWVPCAKCVFNACPKLHKLVTRLHTFIARDIFGSSSRNYQITDICLHSSMEEMGKQQISKTESCMWPGRFWTLHRNTVKQERNQKTWFLSIKEGTNLSRGFCPDQSTTVLLASDCLYF